MFQLIISILAIILAVALAGVSVYYGGSAFSNGSEKADYATLTNQGAQIEAAMTLYRAQEGKSAVGQADDTGTASVDESVWSEVLVAENLLKQVPTGFTVSGSHLISIDVPEAVCGVDKANAILATGDVTAVADIDAFVAQEASGVSGCLKTDATVTNAVSQNIFFYSL